LPIFSQNDFRIVGITDSGGRLATPSCPFLFAYRTLHPFIRKN
jgi:hypothetical protein